MMCADSPPSQHNYVSLGLYSPLTILSNFPWVVCHDPHVCVCANGWPFLHLCRSPVRLHRCLSTHEVLPPL